MGSISVSQVPGHQIGRHWDPRQSVFLVSESVSQTDIIDRYSVINVIKSNVNHLLIPLLVVLSLLHISVRWNLVSLLI